MPTSQPVPRARPAREASVPSLALAALGVVFGDIGTSPLYTLKAVFAHGGGHVDPLLPLGALSLVVWTLIIVTSVKYVSLAMRIDNSGEGGILALMALLGVRRRRRPIVIAVGLLGAALIYGDGAITPAISVLAALEGLDIAAPEIKDYVLPSAVVVLIALFAIQPEGTSRIGKAFGPIMALWFLAVAALGIAGIAQYPSVLLAIDPRHGLRYLFSGEPGSFLVLGGVFLCVTGAEALYADMGHFGRHSIRLAWSLLVFPSLVLNYAGQIGLVLAGMPPTDNIFYHLCPSPLLIPLVILATIATIIASQAVIAGVFSMTHQAIQLGWLPRLEIRHTSPQKAGQIYIGRANWILMFATVGLALGFRNSGNLAGAYGIAVSGTMLMTSVLLFLAMRETWHWSLLAAGSVAGFFLIVDTVFFIANLSKVEQGGYVPLVLAAGIFFVMTVWHMGATAVARRLRATVMPIGKFTQKVEDERIPRVPGTAVFLTSTLRDVPPFMVWHLTHNRALHRHVLVLTVSTRSVPWVRAANRLKFEEIAPDFWRARARYGFMERPNIPALLRLAHAGGCNIDLDDVTYYVGHENVVGVRGRTPRWLEALFAFMQRNSAHVTDYFGLPLESVVEIGRQITI